jgi:GNAT superfamily N-acetyltransferase
MASGARIREATVEDAEGITRCHVGGWKVHYLDAIDFDQRLAVRTRVLGAPPPPGVANWVLEEDRRILGWAATGPARDDDLDESTYELYAIYLDPELVGQGHGRRLMEHCIADATARGHAAMSMWVLTGNERARRFYAAAGFEPDARVDAVPFADSGQTKMRMVRSLRTGT